jgi:hypothetical protein
MPRNAFKNKLVDGLWLPIAKKGGKVIYPRLKKNKRMKMLTLINDSNFQEIFKFEENDLTTRDRVFVWTYSYLKKSRLEPELDPAKVFGSTRYEDSILRQSFSLSGNFPFDLINLNFYSQDPELECGRIEKEIESLEKTIRLQRENENKRFILIYTTLLNSNNLDYRSITNTLGLSSQNFPLTITRQTEKIRCIKKVLDEICSRYDYTSEFREKRYPVDRGKYIWSIAGLVNTK